MPASKAVIGKAMHRVSGRVHNVVRYRKTPWGGAAVRTACGSYLSEDSLAIDTVDPLVTLCETNCTRCLRAKKGTVRSLAAREEGGE